MGEQRQRTPVGSRRPRAVIAAILAAMTLPMISACGERTKAPPMRRPPDGMVLVPAGDYLVGSDETREGPSRTLHLEAFFIDKTPVRDEQYRAWVRRDKTAFDRWTGRLAESERMGRPGYPATNVSQAEASAYCKAQGKRLPLSYEYEAAARGTDGRVFPWGDTWRPDVVNDKAFGPVPVGNFPAGAGPTGAEDLVGNVFHWTRSRVRRTAFHAPERTDPVLGVIKAG